MILDCIRQQFGADASVMLFGSRLDDTARGGDVDLLVESTARATLRQRALVTMALENALNLPVDIVALQRGTPGSAFARLARRCGCAPANKCFAKRRCPRRSRTRSFGKAGSCMAEPLTSQVWVAASQHRPGRTRMALRNTRPVLAWRAID